MGGWGERIGVLKKDNRPEGETSGGDIAKGERGSMGEERRRWKEEGREMQSKKQKRKRKVEGFTTRNACKEKKKEKRQPGG